MSKPPVQIPSELHAHYPEDEVRLTDLALVVYHRRRLLLLIIAGCMVAAGAHLALRPISYTYTTTLEIGSLINEEDGKNQLMPLEPASSVLAKMEQAYVPAVLQELAAGGALPAPITVKVSTPKDTQLVVLNSNGTAADAEKHRQVQQEAAAKLIEDHQRRLVPLKIEMEHALNAAKIHLQELTAEDALELKKQQLAVPLIQETIRLEKLKDPQLFGATKKDAEDGLRVARMKLEELTDPRIIGPRKQGLEEQLIRAKLGQKQLDDAFDLLSAEQRSIDAKQVMLEKQIESLNAALANAALHRRSLLEGKSDTTAMTVMMMDNEIQQNRKRLAELENYLYISLPEKKLQLEQQKDENRRSQVLQQQQINAAEMKLQEFLADIDREVEKQKLVVGQAERKLETLLTENRMEVAMHDPVVNELMVRARKLVPDHEREVAQQKQLIAKLEKKLANLRETRLVVAPLQSLRPVGAGALPILAGALAFAVVAGLIAVFVAEFLSKARDAVAGDHGAARSASQAVNQRVVMPVTRLARDGTG